jgi:hypothetical protein
MGGAQSRMQKLVALPRSVPGLSQMGGCSRAAGPPPTLRFVAKEKSAQRAGHGRKMASRVRER